MSFVRGGLFAGALGLALAVGAVFVLGGPNKDRLYGQRGDDQLNAQGGRDLCHGGPGTDLAARSGCERIKHAHGV